MKRNRFERSDLSAIVCITVYGLIVGGCSHAHDFTRNDQETDSRDSDTSSERFHPPSQLCVDGEASLCVCDDDASGYRTCVESTWSECVCGEQAGSFPAHCGVCHGTLDNPAPLDNGHHEAHLADGGWHKNVQCEGCHKVPQNIGDDGHLTSSPDEFAEFVFANSTCSETYCHHTAFENPTHSELSWTETPQGAGGCTFCHGYPPSEPHPFEGDCDNCHGYSAETHVDGVLDVAGDCDACHGYPPPAPHTSMTICDGCHQPGTAVHLNGTVEAYSGCDACHGNPPSTGGHGIHVTDHDYNCALCHGHDGDAATHGESGSTVINGAYVDITFSGLAVHRSRAPSWDGTRCTNTFCHQPRPEDTAPGQINAPVWTLVDGSQSQCDSCHGFPPQNVGTCSNPARDIHSGDTACASCHSTDCDDSGDNCVNVGPVEWNGGEMVIVRPWLHVNGQKDLPCWDARCHCSTY